MIFYSNYNYNGEGAHRVNWGYDLSEIELLPVSGAEALSMQSEYKGKSIVKEYDLGYVEVEVEQLSFVANEEDIEDDKIIEDKIKSLGLEGYAEAIKQAIKGNDEELNEYRNKGIGRYAELASKGMIEDMMMRIIMSLVREYNLYVLDNFVVLEIQVVRKDEQDKDNYSQNNILSRRNKIDYDEVIIREWGQGYWNIEGYEIDGRTYDIGFETVVYSKTLGRYVIIPRYYGSTLRQALLYNTKGIKEIDPETGEVKYVRRMQKWQYDLISGFAHKTVLSASRRSGKSFVSAYLAIRELLKHNYRGMPKRILYFGLTGKKTKTVHMYLKGLTKLIREATGIFEFKTGAGANVMEYRPRQNKKNKRDVEGSIELLSAGDDSSGVGEYADLIILDEASRMKAELYYAVQPIIDLEGANAFIISTVYWGTVKNWFYDMLLKGERYTLGKYLEKQRQRYKEINKIIDELNKDINIETNELGEIITPDEKLEEYKEIVKQRFLEKHFDIYSRLHGLWEEIEYYGVRYTIDDIERVDKKAIERAKREGKEMGLKQYYCEYYSVFPSEGKVFNIDGRIIEKESGDYERIYIGYDPAKLQDNASFVIVGVNTGGMEIIGNYNYKSVDYAFQVRELERISEEVQQKYGVKPRIIMDATGVGQGVKEIGEIMGLDVYGYIFWKASPGVQYKNGMWYCQKNDMVENLKTLFDRNKIKVLGSLQQLINEFGTYEMIKTDSGNIRYEAVGGTDDAVSATLVATYYAGVIDGYNGKIFRGEKRIDTGLTYKDVHNRLAMLNKQKGVKKLSAIYS